MLSPPTSSPPSPPCSPPTSHLHSILLLFIPLLHKCCSLLFSQLPSPPTCTSHPTSTLGKTASEKILHKSSGNAPQDIVSPHLQAHAQLSIAHSIVYWGRSSVLQVTESWVGPGDEARFTQCPVTRDFLHYNAINTNMTQSSTWHHLPSPRS